MPHCPKQADGNQITKNQFKKLKKLEAVKAKKEKAAAEKEKKRVSTTFFSIF